MYLSRSEAISVPCDGPGRDRAELAGAGAGPPARHLAYRLWVPTFIRLPMMATARAPARAVTERAASQAMS